MGSDIDWHAVQLHACDRRDNGIGHLLALPIDVIEYLVSLRIPEQTTQHGIQGSIFKLFRCESVGGPIGSAKFLGDSEAVVDGDGLSERGSTAICQPNSGHHIKD